MSVNYPNIRLHIRINYFVRSKFKRSENAFFCAKQNRSSFFSGRTLFTSKMLETVSFAVELASYQQIELIVHHKQQTWVVGLFDESNKAFNGPGIVLSP